ncbi:MAG: diguanylate cyclase (GGDEF)-like protein [Paraglaciecola sp.]|jgi:diguanylate cyclase (GGDEF)-like protein
MWDKITDGSFMPHGYALLWRSDLLSLHLGGEILTFISFALIPFALVQIIRKRSDLKFDRIFILFTAFIAFCGMTHLIGAINIWQSYYYIEGIAKTLTGLISMITAVTLWRLMPTILALPSIAVLTERNQELMLAQKELEEIDRTLEKRVKNRTLELEKLANTDELTDLSNRRSTIFTLEKEMKRSQRYPCEMSILMIDVDYFKQVNDEFGHQVGDKVLTNIADILVNTCRQTDSVGRYGGEEFLIILPETNQQAAIDLAERIRLDINLSPNSIKKPITCSIGVASLALDLTMHDFIKKADSAMYKAKDLGRDRVEFATAGVT